MKQGNFLPVVAAALLVLALAGLIIFKLPFQKLSAPRATPTPIPTTGNITLDLCGVLTSGNQVFPALYKDWVSWTSPEITESEVPTAPQPKILKGCLIKSQEISIESSSDVESYYIKESNSKKWVIENAGDAPGTGFVLWRINNSLFLFRIESVPGNMNLKIVTLFLSE